MSLVLRLRLTGLACRSRSNIAWGRCAVEHASAIPTIKVRELLDQSIRAIIVGVLYLSSRISLICRLRRLQVCLLLIMILLGVLSLLLLSLLSRERVVHEVTAATHVGVGVVRIWGEVVMAALSSIYRLRKCRRGGRVDSSIRGIVVLLLVESKIQAKPVIILVHG